MRKRKKKKKGSEPLPPFGGIPVTDFGDITILVVNPFSRKPRSTAQAVKIALEKCPRHGAIKVNTWTAVDAYNQICKKLRKLNPNFRQRIEKLSEGGWILFKDINFCNEFFKRQESPQEKNA